MKLSVEPGKYVLAVSGGVDSIVLLDVLARMPELDLVVAHFDHGIRPESADDAIFVQKLAESHNLPFVTERVELGENASEAVAREARYDFLRRTQRAVEARAIITAHHQDDLLETAIINMIRGTGRKGITALQDREDIKRPFLGIPKTDIVTYATQQNLSWREDTTNYDERYTRNYIRHRLLVRLDPGARQQLLATITEMQQLNAQIDELVTAQLTEYDQAEGLVRRWFSALPHDVSREVMATWLRMHDIADFDRKTIERLTVQAKIMHPGKRLDVLHGRAIEVGREYLAL